MILLTGGSGFIGGHFHQHLNVDQIVNFDLQDPPSSSRSTYVRGDIRRRDQVRKVMDEYPVKTILSLAAKHHDFGIGHDEYFDTNEDGTRILCEEASSHNINEIIFFSSVAVYGQRQDASHEGMVPEPSNAYGASKLAGEKVLADWVAQDAGRKVIVLRPALVYGPNNRANMYNLIRQIDSGIYFHLGRADNIKSIAYVENVVKATLFLMKHAKPGLSIYNYADEPQLTARQIADTIATCLSKKIHLSIPRQIGKLFAYPFDVAIKLTGKNLPVSTARIEKLGTQTLHTAVRIREAGFAPEFTTLEGLKKMVDWYQRETN